MAEVMRKNMTNNFAGVMHCDFLQQIEHPRKNSETKTTFLIFLSSHSNLFRPQTHWAKEEILFRFIHSAREKQ